MEDRLTTMFILDDQKAETKMIVPASKTNFFRRLGAYMPGEAPRDLDAERQDKE